MPTLREPGAWATPLSRSPTPHPANVSIAAPGWGEGKGEGKVQGLNARVAKHFLVPAVLLAVLSVFFCGCESPPSRATGPETAAPYTSNLLKEGDIIQIVFPGATNLNTVQKIPLDGTIKLPIAGEFKAAGKTPQELQTDILNSYGPQLQLKEVTVTLITSSATVYVSGAVLRPGRVPLDRPMTAMEAIMDCGGFDNIRARPSKVTVIRQEGGRQITFRLDLKQALHGKETSPFYLKPSDVVHVPVKTFNL